MFYDFSSAEKMRLEKVDTLHEKEFKGEARRNPLKLN